MTRTFSKSTSALVAALLLGGVAAGPSVAADGPAVQKVTASYDRGAFGVTSLTIQTSAKNGVASVRISTSAGRERGRQPGLLHSGG
ncbi:hypothetical protein ACWD6R_08765 [Streptomyces sp. NPDC005151]